MFCTKCGRESLQEGSVCASCVAEINAQVAAAPPPQPVYTQEPPSSAAAAPTPALPPDLPPDPAVKATVTEDGEVLLSEGNRRSKRPPKGKKYGNLFTVIPGVLLCLLTLIFMFLLAASTDMVLTQEERDIVWELTNFNEIAELLSIESKLIP